jgi:hypothetical protein
MNTSARREREKTMTQVPSEPPQGGRRRQTRLFLTVSLAAAILIIGVVIVTSVLLFNRYRTANQAHQGTHPIRATLSSCAALPWPVFVDLCTHHQFKDLLQRRTMGDYVLVVERAYLDMNQLVMSYRVFSQATGQQTLADLEAVITTSQGQSLQYYAGAWKNGGPQVFQARTPPVPAQTRALQFHVEVDRFRLEDLAHLGTAPASQIIAVPRPVSFDFTLEYHGGLVVTPRQTVTVQALSVTLERVRISPSETILEGTTKGTGPSSPGNDTFTLNAAGRSPDFPASSNFGFGGESTPFSVEYEDGLLGQHGTWTFEIAGSWEFHFSVP